MAALVGPSGVLHAAAEKGDAGQCQLALSQGADVNSIDVEDRTPLYKAAKYGHGSCIAAILSTGRCILDYQCTKLKLSALYVAAANGRAQTVEQLIQAGASMETPSRSGWTALHIAAQSGHEAVVAVLLRYGANREARHAAGKTPMEEAKPNVKRLFLQSSSGQPAPQRVTNPPQSGLNGTPTTATATAVRQQTAAAVVDETKVLSLCLRIKEDTKQAREDLKKLEKGEKVLRYLEDDGEGGVDSAEGTKFHDMVAGGVEHLGNLLPAPFGTVLHAISFAVRLSIKVKVCQISCRELADRLASLHPFIVKLVNLPPNQATPIVERIQHCVQSCTTLMKKFAPEEEGAAGAASSSGVERLLSWGKRKVAQLTTSTEEFTAAHQKIDRLLGDFNFSALVNVTTDVPRAPHPEESKLIIRGELEALRAQLQSSLANQTETIRSEGQQMLEAVNASVANLTAHLGEQVQSAVADALKAQFDSAAGLIDASHIIVTRPSTPIGRGGFAEVFEGLLRGELTVAVKQYQNAGSAAATDAASAEGGFLRGFNHPNIVRCYGYVPQQGKVVMELLPYSLAQLTAEGTATLPTATKLSISTDIISALTYLHSQRPAVLHGDLKPENVMLLTRRGPAKLIDFGSAVRKETFAVSKLSSGAKDDGSDSSATLSAHYTAPEFFQKAERTMECDMYALGVLLFELWSGKSAWKGLNLQEICTVVCAGQRPATEDEMISSLFVPPIIARIIHLSWSTDPKTRPLSAVLNQIRSIEDPLGLKADQLPAYLARSDLQHALAGAPAVASEEPKATPLHTMSAQQLADYLQANGVDASIIRHMHSEGYSGDVFLMDGFVEEEIEQSGKFNKWHVAKLKKLRDAERSKSTS